MINTKWSMMQLGYKHRLLENRGGNNLFFWEIVLDAGKCWKGSMKEVTCDKLWEKFWQIKRYERQWQVIPWRKIYQKLQRRQGYITQRLTGSLAQWFSVRDHPPPPPPPREHSATSRDTFCCTTGWRGGARARTLLAPREQMLRMLLNSSQCIG